MRQSETLSQSRPERFIQLPALSLPPNKATKGVAGAISRRSKAPTQIRTRRFRATPAGSRMSVRTTPLVHMGVDERTQGAESHSEKASLINFQCGKTLSFRANHLKVQRVFITSLHFSHFRDFPLQRLLFYIPLVLMIFNCSDFCFHEFQSKSLL